MSIVSKDERQCIIIDIALSSDSRFSDKEKEKVEKYQDLKKEIKKNWNMWGVKVLLVMLGALGRITKKLEKLDITLTTVCSRRQHY